MLILVDPEDEHLLTDYNWRITSKGYAYGWTGEKSEYLHHVVLRKHGIDIKGIVDHDNRNKLDNRKTNLKDVNYSVSNHNRGAQLRTHEMQGLPKNVYYQSTRKRPYMVQIMVEGDSHFLGRYATVEEADAVAKQFRVEHGLPA